MTRTVMSEDTASRHEQVQVSLPIQVSVGYRPAWWMLTTSKVYLALSRLIFIVLPAVHVHILQAELPLVAEIQP